MRPITFPLTYTEDNKGVKRDTVNSSEIIMMHSFVTCMTSYLLLDFKATIHLA